MSSTLPLKSICLALLICTLCISTVYSALNHSHYSAQTSTSCGKASDMAQSLLEQLYNKASSDAEKKSVSIVAIDSNTNFVGECDEAEPAKNVVLVIVTLSVIFGASSSSSGWFWWIWYAVLGLSLVSCCALSIFAYRRRQQMLQEQGGDVAQSGGHRLGN